jgi:hypothetical protein
MEKEDNKAMSTQLTDELKQYYFHHDHIVRGPLCRAQGLVNLLEYKNLPEDLEDIVSKLKNELQELNKGTFLLSDFINVIEHKISSDKKDIN